MNKINEHVFQESGACFAFTMFLLNASILSAALGIIWLVYFLFEQVGSLAMFARQFS